MLILIIYYKFLLKNLIKLMHDNRHDDEWILIDLFELLKIVNSLKKFK